MTDAPRRERFSAVPAALGAAGVAVLLPLSMFLVSAWLLGWQLLTVESASMAPVYPVGALLVSDQVNPADVRVGTPIIFEDPATPGRLVTHRVVGVANQAPLAFWTQGDANAVRDPVAVPARLIRARVLWQVPALGRAMEWLQWPRSFVLLVVIPAGVLVAMEWRRRREPQPPSQAPVGA